MRPAHRSDKLLGSDPHGRVQRRGGGDMYVRVTRVQNTPERLEATITGFTQEVVPALRRLPGNCGATLLVNRETGAAAGVSYWETKDALTASEEVAGILRAQHVPPAGAMVIETAQYELIAQYRTA